MVNKTENLPLRSLSLEVKGLFTKYHSKNRGGPHTPLCIRMEGHQHHFVLSHNLSCYRYFSISVTNYTY